MVKTPAQPYKHMIQTFMYTSIIYNKQPVTQDSNNNWVWHRKVGCQKQTAPVLLTIRSGPASTSQALTRWRHQSTHLIIALLLIYLPRNDERLSWPSWLTCSGRFTQVVTRQL